MTKSILRGLAILLLAAWTTPLMAAAATKPEEFRYSWRLRGGLAWLAGLKFPLSGSGALRNSPMSGDLFESELVITGGDGDEGLYVYRSEIANDAVRTMTTFHGYEWDGKKRNEQTRFDYDDGLARVRKERAKGISNEVDKLPAGEMRDVLTGIHFLRRKAGQITGPLRSEIYSDGKIYPVLFQPLGTRNVMWRGTTVAARGFEIKAAPGSDKRWPGGVKVWLTPDDQAIPLRIEIARGSLASLQLELETAR